MTSLTSARPATLYWSESTPMASLLGRLDRLEHALPGRAGRVVDDVGAAVELAAGHLLALRRVVEAGEVAGRAEVLDVDLDVRGDRLGALHVAGLELLDQRHLDAADEADLAGLGLQRGGGADQERALLLGEDQRRDVGQLDRAVVDDRELRLRDLGWRPSSSAVAYLKPTAMIGLKPSVASWRSRVAAASSLSLAAAASSLVFAFDAEVGDRLLQPGRGGVVERVVAAAADVVGQPDLERAGVGVGGGGGRGRAAGRRRRRRGVAGALPALSPPPAGGAPVPVSRAQPTTTSALVSTAAASTKPRLIRTEERLLFRPGRPPTRTTTGP